MDKDSGLGKQIQEIIDEAVAPKDSMDAATIAYVQDEILRATQTIIQPLLGRIEQLEQEVGIYQDGSKVR